MNLYLVFFILLTSFITGCDPGHSGRAYIDNMTPDTLVLNYRNRYRDTTITILPSTKKEVLEFGGLGPGRDYPGCLVEFDTISLRPSDKNRYLTKDIRNYGNWKMINNNRYQFSGKAIVCCFTVDKEDIR